MIPWSINLNFIRTNELVATTGAAAAGWGVVRGALEGTVSSSTVAVPRLLLPLRISESQHPSVSPSAPPSSRRNRFFLPSYCAPHAAPPESHRRFGRSRVCAGDKAAYCRCNKLVIIEWLIQPRSTPFLAAWRTWRVTWRPLKGWSSLQK